MADFLEHEHTQEQKDEPMPMNLLQTACSKLILPDYVQQELINVRAQIILERAYEQIKFNSGYDAAAAHGYSLGQLRLIDTIIDHAQVTTTV